MNETRTSVLERIATKPGVHFSQLVRDLDVAPGQAQYHLKRLHQDEQITTRQLYGQTHYYPPSYTDRQQRIIALLRRETSRDIVTHLVTHGAASPKTVSTELDIARSTLEWHLDRLTEQGVVEKRYDERNRVTLEVSDNEAVIPLLTTVDATLSERLVDRFERLVDHLLDDV
jgi:predicted transcriptional regulator